MITCESRHCQTLLQNDTHFVRGERERVKEKGMREKNAALLRDCFLNLGFMWFNSIVEELKMEKKNTTKTVKTLTYTYTNTHTHKEKLGMI